MTEKLDYLDTDPAVAGQQFCCISFVSPNSLCEEREKFYVQEFLRAEAERLGLKESPEDVLARYENYKFREENRLLGEFQQKYPTQSTVQGLKIRGSYETLEQAKARAAYLQRIDPHFNVFVGQVGYWLPWNPRSDTLKEEVFAEEELNTLIGKYKENVQKTDEFWRAETQRRIEEARREGQAGREATQAARVEEVPETQTATQLLETLEVAEEPRTN